jgi:hypothetical protein
MAALARAPEIVKKITISGDEKGQIPFGPAPPAIAGPEPGLDSA